MGKKKRTKATSECHGCGVKFEGVRRFCTPRCKKLLECKAMGTTKFLNRKIAPLFQKLIRCEAGADPRQYVTAVVNGKIRQVERRVGQCVCVTCGKVDSWDSGIKGIHAGHFVASRRASILLEEDNLKPQCSRCNFYRSGAPSEFRMYMEAVAGIEVIERLQQLKTQSVSFSRDELVDMWFEFSTRLKEAIERMKR